MTSVSICVCTFRRPELSETLGSLARLRLSRDIRAEIIVVDNDATPSARGAVEEARRHCDIAVRYVHAPYANISIARNAAMDASEARFLAFIDDDETASPGWLAALLQAQQATGADIVLGPVNAIYQEDAPEWMRASDLHSTMPVVSRGEIRTGYSGNVLIDRASPAVAGLRFDLALGKTGGEDTVFFGAAYRSGASLVFAADAVVTEPVPASRCSMRWLADRKLRSGRTHARLRLEIDNRNRWVELALASAKAGYCAAASLARLPWQRRRNMSALRFLFHAGVVAELARGPGVKTAHEPLMRVAEE